MKSPRFLLVLALCSPFALIGCDDPKTPPVPGADGYAVPTAKPDGTYTVRGRVTRLPGEREPGSELRVEHEAIPTFKDKTGQVVKDKDGREVGMAHMIMPFPPAKGVPVNSLRVGDVIEITFSVWWNENPSYLMTDFKRLPADTVLSFDAAKGGEAGAGGAGTGTGTTSSGAPGAAPTDAPTAQKKPG